MTTWSPQQSRALDEVGEWMRDRTRQVFYLAGYAGTGKTTLAQHLAASANGLTLFAAFTGKAASVLRAKGCADAATLHSLLYQVEEKSNALLEALIEERADLASAGLPTREIDRQIAEERARVRRPSFRLNPASVVARADLVVLDECSMVNEPLARDLLSFGKKVLVLGDPAQLPPVKGAGYFTSRTPNLLLTEIHRQALDNPIIRWAHLIREGCDIDFGAEGPAQKIRKRETTMEELVASGNQLLTGKNVTRRKLNMAARRALGYIEHPYPVKGDRLVVLRNDRELRVMNGVTCEAMSPAEYDEEFMEGSFGLTFRYEGHPVQTEVDTAAFDVYTGDDLNAEPDFAPFGGPLPMDYGYALTVHKAQGSQWDGVTICDDGFGAWNREMRRQWLYTAITRAAERLLIVVGG